MFKEAVVLLLLLLYHRGGCVNAIGSMTRRPDGLVNYYIGTPTVPQTSDSPTTVTLPTGYLVYGSRIEYVSGTGTSDPTGTAGTLGDTRYGSWVTIYVNGHSSSVLVPSFSYDSELLSTYNFPPTIAYKLRSADIATLTGGYDLRCSPTWLAAGTTVSIWNSDSVKSNNQGSETIKWYLIIKYRSRTASQTRTATSARSASRTTSGKGSASSSPTRSTNQSFSSTRSWTPTTSITAEGDSTSATSTPTVTPTPPQGTDSTQASRTSSQSINFTTTRSMTASATLTLAPTPSRHTDSVTLAATASRTWSATRVDTNSAVISATKTLQPKVSSSVLTAAGQTSTVTAASTAGASVATQGSPLLASQAGRLVSLRALLECSTESQGSTDDQPLDPMSYPLGLAWEGAGRQAMYNAPCVLFDAGLVAVCWLVNVGAMKGADRYRAHSNKHVASLWKGAERYASFLFAFSVLFFSQPVTGAAVTSALLGNAVGVAVGVFGMVLSLGCMVIPIVVYRLRFDRRVEGTPRDTKGQPWWKWVVSHSTRWTVRAEAEGDDTTSATQLLVRRWGVWFEGYCPRAPWFVVVELTLNVVSGVAGALTSSAGCDWGAIMTVVAYALYFVVLMALRPQGVPVDFALTALIAAVQLAATVLAVQKSQPDVAATMLYTSSIVSAVFGLKELLRVVVVRYKRLKNARSGGPGSGYHVFEASHGLDACLIAPEIEAPPSSEAISGFNSTEVPAQADVIPDFTSDGVQSDRLSTASDEFPPFGLPVQPTDRVGDATTVPRTFNPLHAVMEKEMRRNTSSSSRSRGNSDDDDTQSNDSNRTLPQRMGSRQLQDLPQPQTCAQPIPDIDTFLLDLDRDVVNNQATSRVRLDRDELLNDLLGDGQDHVQVVS